VWVGVPHNPRGMHSKVLVAGLEGNVVLIKEAVAVGHRLCRSNVAMKGDLWLSELVVDL